jgi:hypothetical protein
MDEVGENELFAACRDGRQLDCLSAGGPRAVGADIIRRCFISSSDIDPRGLRLRNAVVVGTLDLAGLTVPFPIRFESCRFDAALVLEGARLDQLMLTDGTRLPGLLANGLSVRRDLDLSGSIVTGAHATSASTSKHSAIWLCESDIGGRLLCVDTSILADGERSLQADRMHVGGTIRLLHSFVARGEMRLIGAQIDGSLDLTGAHIRSDTGVALDLADAIIGGSVFLIGHKPSRRPVIEGRIDMGSTRIAGQLLIRDAKLVGRSAVPADSAYSPARSGTVAVSAARMSVGAEVTLEGRCQVFGGLDFSMSEMSSLYVAKKCFLRGIDSPAIDMTNAELRSTMTISGTGVAGTLCMRGARIRGDLSLQNVRLRVSAGRAVEAQGIAVDGDVLLREMSASGGPVEFRGATLRGGVDAKGAKLSNPDGYTLSLHHAVVRGSVGLVGLRSTGSVVLNRAAIEGRLECTDATMVCPRKSEFNKMGHALRAISATVRGGMELGWTEVSPSLDLTNAKTTYLADDPRQWPNDFLISGLTYERFGQSRDTVATLPWNHGARIAWLSRQENFDAGPYEQAAAVFRQHGHVSSAEAILIAQRKQAGRISHGGRASPKKLLDDIHRATVGYGYRPGRVLWLIAALLVVVSAALHIPAAQATLRASDAAGDVYTTSGLLTRAGGTAASAIPSSSVASMFRPIRDPHLVDAGRHSHRRGDSCGNGQIRCFSFVLYAIDTVVPLISLDQRSTWYPDPHLRYGTLMEWVLNLATLLGWLLSSIFVLSLARLARNL